MSMEHRSTSKIQSNSTIVYEYADKTEPLQLSSRENSTSTVPLQQLKLKLPKKVSWTEDTVDNELMNKKKSKICCIFKKPITNPDDTSEDSCSSCDEKRKNAYERPMHYDRKKVK